MAVEITSSMFRIPNARKALNLLRTPDGRVQSSNGENFGGMFHGRDSLTMARDLIGIDQEFVRGVLVNNARLLGAKNDPKNEEEPWKVLHELRPKPKDGHEASDNLLTYQQAAKSWGETEEGILYYGSQDASLKFIIVLGEYVKKYGKTILEAQINLRDGKQVSIEDCAYGVTGLISSWIKRSDLGFVEYQRKNPEGIENQIQRDSLTSMMHTDGTLANHTKPIATIDLQAEANDALNFTPVIFNSGKYSAEVPAWLKLAKEHQDNTLKQFWSEEMGYMHSFIDRDNANQIRKSLYVTSLPGYLLDSAILDDIPLSEQRKFVKAIGDRLFGSEMMATSGIRCVSTIHPDIPGFVDYHGRMATWPVEGNRYSRGARRRGAPLVAQQIDTRIMNAVVLAGGFPEFFYDDPDTNTAWYQPRKLETADQETVGIHPVILGTNIPEFTQGWTDTAVIAIENREVLHPDIYGREQSDWERNQEQIWLQRIPQYSPLLDVNSLLEGRSNVVWVDIQKGRAADDLYRQSFRA